ncbi:MAG TPA: serine hydrolase domain-containing protein, partial [Longimicrobiales bacterium]|nr:serine hydrolase domain-containing protein [Longimicrobiales bacterium]
LHPFGFRDLEARDSMRANAIFRIASQTKALTTVAAMILQEEGKLLITDPVGKYLPEYQKTKVAIGRDSGRYEIVDAKRAITIRDLMTHTAGISYGSGPARELWTQAGINGWYFADRDEPIRETIRRLASLPFDAQPGERFVYGYATDILGVIVEVVSGKPLDQFIAERILKPLKLNDTQFFLPPSKRNRLVTVYSAGKDGTVSRTADDGGMQSQGKYVDGPRKSFSGGAGLTSTASDYGRFLQMLLNGGEMDGVRILSRKSVELMLASHLSPEKYPEPGNAFGLGFRVLTDLGANGQLGSVGQWGWGNAYHGTYWVDPKEKMIVVYMTQLIPAGSIDDFAKVRALIYQALN